MILIDMYRLRLLFESQLQGILNKTDANYIAEDAEDVED